MAASPQTFDLFLRWIGIQRGGEKKEEIIEPRRTPLFLSMAMEQFAAAKLQKWTVK